MNITESSELANLGVLASITAAGLLFGGVAIGVADREEPPVQPAVLSQRCQDADRATVVQLIEILSRYSNAIGRRIRPSLSVPNMALASLGDIACMAGPILRANNMTGSNVG